MRFFAELAYHGNAYCGWQRQPGQTSVQEVIEDALSTILQAPVEVTGCGRTDTGVHARRYFLHFDYDRPFPPAFLRRLNRFLPPDIAFFRLIEVAPDAHARFDATARSYEYHLLFDKNPFEQHTAYHYPFAAKLDLDQLQAAATLLLEYTEFYPFCKSHTDVKTMRCDLRRSEWLFDTDARRLVYHVTADRFLRGMVRLIVGMCLNVALGKTDLATVQEALDRQSRLPGSHSAPPQGLFLTDIRYPFLS